jgi:hypothetical protein
MGNQCCSNSSVSTASELSVDTTAGIIYKGAQLSNTQIRLIIKLQSVFRGHMDRKKVKLLRSERYAPGMANFRFDKDAAKNYDNPRVQVSQFTDQLVLG